MSAWSFGQEFQRSLLRLMVDDEAFCALACKHLEPGYFENGALGWIFAVIQRYFDAYGRPPTQLVLYETARQLEAAQAMALVANIDAIVQARVVESEYIGERLVDFVKRNLFVEGIEHLRQLYNAGDVDKAYEFWARRSEEIHEVNLGIVDRSFFFDQLDDRAQRRAAEAAVAHHYTFSTGIPDLDGVLSGGLHKGELGIWVAYPKVGKSMMLTWLAYYAVRALRVPVLYIVLEGGREQAEDRFEAAFAYTSTQLLRRGELDHGRMRMLYDEYRELKDLLVIRGYTKNTDAWNASIDDLYAEIRELRQRHGFKPRMIDIDYGDLMRARREMNSEFEEQKAVFRDVKALCDRDDGYAIWTASQAQRPPKGAENNPNHVVKSSQIADCYEKVRAADFIGTLNRTKEEEAQERMRIYAELYRSAPAGRLITVNTDYAHSRAFTSVAATSRISVEIPHEQLEADL